MSTQQPGTQLTRTQQQVVTIRDLLEKQKKQMALALPKHMTPDRMLRIVMTSIQKTPLLLNCSRESLLGAVMQAAQLGLEPDGVLGKAYLIPRKRKGNWECQFQTGYKGLIDLAYRSGQVAFIAAEVVRSKDFLEVNLGTDRSLKHRPFEPTEAEDDPGTIRAFYAVAKLKDGSVHFVFMWHREVDRIKDEFSDAADSSFSPWNTNELTYIEMGKKTALRRLCKTLPASTELQTAVSVEEHQEAGLPVDLGDYIEIPTDGAEQPGDTKGPEPEPKPAGKLDQIVNGKTSGQSKVASPAKPEPKAEPPKPNVPEAAAPQVDPETTCTEEQFAKLDELKLDMDVDTKDVLAFVKTTLGYKMYSHLKVKDFDRVKHFISNGGKEFVQ